MKHKTEILNGIQVDSRMVPLIKECWRLGWRTCGSCQGARNFRDRAYVAFEHLEDALQMWSFIKDADSHAGDRLPVSIQTGPFPDSVYFDSEDIVVITEHLKKFPGKSDSWLPEQ